MRRLRCHDAFTLIELLVVILILGILIAVAAPSFLGQAEKAHDSAAKQHLSVAYRTAAAAKAENLGSYPAASALAAAIAASEPQLTVGLGDEGTGKDSTKVFVDANGADASSASRVVLHNQSGSGRQCTLTAAQSGAPAIDCLPPPQAQTFAFAAIGDQNGYLYWRGTNGGSGAWANPVLHGVTLSASSSAWPVERAVDRGSSAPDSWWGSGGSGAPWWQMDLGPGHSLKVSSFSYVGSGSQDGPLLAGSKLYGSQDGATWVELVNVLVGCGGSCDSPGTTVTVGTPVAYRYFRLQRASTDTWWRIAELEFYGEGL